MKDAASDSDADHTLQNTTETCMRHLNIASQSGTKTAHSSFVQKKKPDQLSTWEILSVRAASLSGGAAAIFR
jgi:hypothetical protein